MASKTAALVLAALTATLLLASAAAAQTSSLEDELRSLLRQLDQYNSSAAAPMIPLEEAVRLYTGLAKCSMDPAVGADALRAVDTLKAIEAGGRSRSLLAQWRSVTRLLVDDAYRAALRGLLRSCSAGTVYYALLYANAVPVRGKLILAGFNSPIFRSGLAEALEENGLPEDAASAVANLVASDPVTAAAAAALATRPSPSLWELVAKQAGSAESIAALVALADPETIPPTVARHLLVRLITEASPDVAPLGPAAWLAKAGAYYDEALKTYMRADKAAAKPLILYLALTKLLERAYLDATRGLAKLPTYRVLYRTALEETPTELLEMFRPLSNSTLDLEALAKAWYAVKTGRLLLPAIRGQGLDPVAASAALWTSRGKGIVFNLTESMIYVNASRSPACEAAASLVKQAVLAGPYASQALWARAAAAAALCASDTGSAKPVEALLTIQPFAAPSPAILEASSLQAPEAIRAALIGIARALNESIHWAPPGATPHGTAWPRLSPGWVTALIRRGNARELLYIARSFGDRALVDVALQLAEEAAPGQVPSTQPFRAFDTVWVFNEIEKLKKIVKTGGAPEGLQPVIRKAVRYATNALRRGDVESAAAVLTTLEQIISDYKAIEAYAPAGPVPPLGHTPGQGASVHQSGIGIHGATGPGASIQSSPEAGLVKKVLEAARQAQLMLRNGGSTEQLPEALRGKHLMELIREALRLVREGLLRPEDIKPLLDLAERQGLPSGSVEPAPLPRPGTLHPPAPSMSSLPRLGVSPPPLSGPSLSAPGMGTGGGVMLLALALAGVAAALLVKHGSAAPRLRLLRRRGSAGSGGSGSESSLGPRELVIELFRELLALYGRLVRPKRLYETHREYAEAVPGEERSLYTRAAMIYEEAKFSRHPIGQAQVKTMAEIVERVEKLHEEGAERAGER